MKILFLMDQMYLHGGGERMLSQKINYLISHFKYEIHLITTEQKNEKFVYTLNKKLHWTDLNVNYERQISYFHPKNVLKSIRHFRLLKKEIQRIQPHVIVSVSFSPEHYFLPFIQKKIPKIKEFHSSRFDYKASFLRRRLDVLFEKYDALVVLNDTEKNYYKNNNTVVIPNFTDFKSHSNIAFIKEKTVIAAGRIAPVKQFNELIEIWKIIANDFPEWKLKIFGNGLPAAIEDLQIIIKELNLSDCVFILPSVPTIQNEMQKASIYAMSSLTECFPMVLLEAQASGLPIVTYDCPNGPRHIITDKEDGFLIAPNDKNAFSKALILLMMDEKLRLTMGTNAIKNVLIFSEEKVMNQWNLLFTRLMK